jgi:hypothetical protein
MALVIAAVLLGWVFWRKPPSNRDSSGATAGVRMVSGQVGTTPVAESRNDSDGPPYEKAVGRWLRSDGGYVIEILAADASSGRLEAKYLNPQPIHVSRAEAKHEGGKLTVFVELQDVNYPGSTYRLTYFPATDQLFGTYYQAALDQSFEVEFGRSR